MSSMKTPIITPRAPARISIPISTEAGTARKKT